MGYWVLLTMAAFFTLLTILIGKWNVSQSWGNMLISVLSAVCWLALFAYNNTNPPATITVGSTVHEWLTLIYVGMALFMIITGVMVTRASFKEEVMASGGNAKTLMELSPEEYKATIRTTVRGRRRR